MRRPHWTLAHATIVSAFFIACSDDPQPQRPADRVEKAGDRAEQEIEDAARKRQTDADADRRAPREPGANAPGHAERELGEAGRKIDAASDRAEKKIDAAGDKAADSIEKAGETIDAAAKKTSEKLREDS
jgi:hypothetical protein